MKSRKKIKSSSTHTVKTGKNNNKNMENKREREREKENENVKRNVMGKNFHSILLCAIENLQIAFCFHCSNEAYSRLLLGRVLATGGGEASGYGGQSVVTKAGAFEHLAWLSLCAVLFLFLLANQLADWLNEKLHCKCVCVLVCVCVCAEGRVGE